MPTLFDANKQATTTSTSAAPQTKIIFTFPRPPQNYEDPALWASHEEQQNIRAALTELGMARKSPQPILREIFIRDLFQRLPGSMTHKGIAHIYGQLLPHETPIAEQALRTPSALVRIITEISEQLQSRGESNQAAFDLVWLLGHHPALLRQAAQQSDNNLFRDWLPIEPKLDSVTPGDFNAANAAIGTIARHLIILSNQYIERARVNTSNWGALSTVWVNFGYFTYESPASSVLRQAIVRKELLRTPLKIAGVTLMGVERFRTAL